MTQQRGQSLQAAGIAVTAFGGEPFSIVNSTGTAAMTPGLNYAVRNGEPGQIVFFLHGVGRNGFADANEKMRAIHVDGTTGQPWAA